VVAAREPADRRADHARSRLRQPRWAPRLRDAIAEYTRLTRGTRCDADQIYITGGAQRGLDLVCRVLLDPGAHAAVEDPGYPARGMRYRRRGADRPRAVDDQGLSVAALSCTPGIRLTYVTPSHQFPTGAAMSLARRRALLAWAVASGRGSSRTTTIASFGSARGRRRVCRGSTPPSE